MAKRIKIAYVKSDELTPSIIKNNEDSDVLCVLSKPFSSLSVKDELIGRSGKLSEFSRLTSNVKGLTFLSLTTNSFSTYHRSIAVFEQGRLIKLADSSACEKKPFSPSFGFKTITSGGVKVGVAVGKDLCSSACLNCFYYCDCDAIINLSADFYDFSTETLVSALSYLYGLTIVSVNSNKSVVAVCGKVELSSTLPFGECAVTLKKNYKEISFKKRGNIL